MMIVKMVRMAMMMDDGCPLPHLKHDLYDDGEDGEDGNDGNDDDG